MSSYASTVFQRCTLVICLVGISSTFMIVLMSQVSSPILVVLLPFVRVLQGFAVGYLGGVKADAGDDPHWMRKTNLLAIIVLVSMSSYYLFDYGVLAIRSAFALDTGISVGERLAIVDGWIESETGDRGFIGYLKLKYEGREVMIETEVEDGFSQQFAVPLACYQIILLAWALQAAFAGVRSGLREALLTRTGRSPFEGFSTPSVLSATGKYLVSMVYALGKQNTISDGLPDRGPWNAQEKVINWPLTRSLGRYSVNQKTTLEPIRDMALIVNLDEGWPNTLLEKAQVFINDVRIASIEYLGWMSGCPEPGSDNDTAIIQNSWNRQGSQILWCPPNGILPQAKGMTASLTFEVTGYGDEPRLVVRSWKKLGHLLDPIGGIDYSFDSELIRNHGDRTFIIAPGERVKYLMSIIPAAYDRDNVSICLDIESYWPDALDNRADIQALRDLRWCTLSYFNNDVCPLPNSENDAVFLSNSVTRKKNVITWCPPNGFLPANWGITAEIEFTVKANVADGDCIRLRGDRFAGNAISRFVPTVYIIQRHSEGRQPGDVDLSGSRRMLINTSVPSQSLSPQPAYAYLNRGLMYMDIKNFQAAYDDFNAAVQLYFADNPNRYRALVGAGQALYQMGKFEKAANRFNDVIQSEVADPEIKANAKKEFIITANENGVRQYGQRTYLVV